MDRKEKQEKQYSALPDRETALKRISEMEEILDLAVSRLDELDRLMEEYEAFQPELKKLETYYTGPQWKADLAMDEAGVLPDNLKRGVLSEDGIYNVLERNLEMLEKIRHQR